MDWVAVLGPLIAVMAAIWLVGVGLAFIGRPGPIALSLLALLCGGGLNGYVALQGLAFLLLAVLLAAAALSVRGFAKSSAAVTALLWGWIGWTTYSEVTRLEGVRLDHPLVSIAHRLSYEPSYLASAGAPAPSLSSDVESALYDFSDYQRDREADDFRLEYRSEILEELHQHTYVRFTRTMGFGVYRMRRLPVDVVPLPRRDPIRLECSRPDSAEPASASIAQSIQTDVVSLTPRQLTEVHWTSAGDFLVSNRLGFALDRNHVAGFEPHAFSKAPQLVVEEAQDENKEPWEVVSLELVGLLKHDTPRVYESEYLPNMELLSSDDIPTRELDEFEAAALPQLRTERDVVIDTESVPGTIRMLGSLRADTDCTQCHNVRRGELLGAFSYRLRAMAALSGATEGP